MYVYVAPPTLVGAWSMALVLQQDVEYYYTMHLIGTLDLYTEHCHVSAALRKTLLDHSLVV